MNRRRPIKIAGVLSALTLFSSVALGVNVGAVPGEENRLAAPRTPSGIVSSSTITIEPAGEPRVKDASCALPANTVITPENLTQVLRYLGLDGQEMLPLDPDDSSGLDHISTVGELEAVLDEIEELSSAGAIHTSDTPIEPISSSASPRGIVMGSGNIRLSDTNPIGSTYTLTYSCSANYDRGKWTLVTGGDVSISTGSVVIGTKHKIDSKDYIYCQILSDQTTIRMDSTIHVGAYVVIAGIGLFRTNSTKIEGTSYWYFHHYK